MDTFLTILYIVFGSVTVSVLGGIWILFNSKAWKGKSLNKAQQKVVRELEAESLVLRERVETLEKILHDLDQQNSGERRHG